MPATKRINGRLLAGGIAGVLLLGLILLMVFGPGRSQAHAESYTREELTGHIDPESRGDFAAVPLEYTAGRTGLYLRRETLEAFERMREAALQDGIPLTVISATRNFNWQKGIWEAKWTGTRLVNGVSLAATVPDPVQRAETILRYSSMPGTSRHHWGTDVDLNSLENSYFESGEGEKIYRWLCEHAYDYGFAQPYTAFGDGRSYGYQEEKWHWSYLPVAVPMLHAYTNEVELSDISGFTGSQTAAALDVIKVYVLGVNEKCFSWGR